MVFYVVLQIGSLIQQWSDLESGAPMTTNRTTFRMCDEVRKRVTVDTRIETLMELGKNYGKHVIVWVFEPQNSSIPSPIQHNSLSYLFLQSPLLEITQTCSINVLQAYFK